MKGANQEFIDRRERFLENNLIVMQGSLQYQVIGLAQMKNHLGNSTQVGETHMGDVWEFDLVEVPGLFDTVRAKGASPKGKPPRVYELRLLDRYDLEPSGELGAANQPLMKSVHRKIHKHTHRIRGFYCPWAGDKIWSVKLDDRADFLFTATLNGCTVQFKTGANPTFSHANYLNALTQQIDQHTIDTELAKRHLATDPKLQKDDYTNTNKKADRLARGEVLDYLATVIGFRDDNTDQWSFFYQSYKKLQTLSTSNPSVTMNNVVLRDRAVQL
jgi:hypothetical protein